MKGRLNFNALKLHPCQIRWQSVIVILTINGIREMLFISLKVINVKLFIKYVTLQVKYKLNPFLSCGLHLLQNWISYFIQNRFYGN